MGETKETGREAVTSGTHAPDQQPESEVSVAPAHSKRSPAFQFYPRDFLSSVKVDRMPMTERGAYITLLARCWLENGLPTDLTELAYYVRMKPTQFRRMWENGQIGKCFTERGGKFRNERLDDEHAKQTDYKRRQSDNGKKGGRPKGLGSSGLSDHKASTKATESSSSSSSFVSASSTAVEGARQTSIVKRRRMDAAYEHASGMYVPQRAHDDLLPMHPREQELFDWYPVICERWTGRNTGADMIKFWKARHDEQWPAERVATSVSSGGRGLPPWHSSRKAAQS